MAAFTVLHDKAVPCGAVAMCPTMDLVAVGAQRGGTVTVLVSVGGAARSAPPTTLDAASVDAA